MMLARFEAVPEPPFLTESEAWESIELKTGVEFNSITPVLLVAVKALTR